MLKSIKLKGVGPVHDLKAFFGERLNIITGDNGLGKSFLLDVCFWILTDSWPGRRMAIPDQNYKVPTISYDIGCDLEVLLKKATYNFKLQSWKRQQDRPPKSGLVIYAAVDGSFSVWDPARNYLREPRSSTDANEWPRAFQFPPESSSNYDNGSTASIRRDVANGLEEGGRVLCNGLIADWNEWFYQRSNRSSVNPFEYLEAAITTLSHPLEPLHCEEPQKVFLDDSRKFPTLRMPYGIVPYPQWSASVKRIVSFAYLIIWAWVEHLQAAKLRKEDPTNQIVLIVDEIEAHLHPKWQRTILPAILEVVSKLQPNISVQIFAATHSPLVLASLEPHFDEEKDQLFHFNFDTAKTSGQMISFDALPWAVHGDMVGWLTSDIFGLEQARSREAEVAIEAAEAFMRDDSEQLPPGLSTKEEINEQLRKLLPSLDPFWPRWIVRTSS
jgi:AAA domain, putative AbiEii toxin, Type IV TA system/AAA domain